MPIADFGLLARDYPDYWNYPLPDGVKKLIGGEAKDRDITNTCTIRMSHALNATGIAVPHVWEAITNRRGANGKYYIIRVANFRTWLTHKMGKPDVDFRKTAGDAFDRNQIRGMQGIIAFEIGFSDATGHFDLWYGDKFSHEAAAGKDYFALATRISLWTTGVRETVASA
jgi:hypothetical protein